MIKFKLLLIVVVTILGCTNNKRSTNPLHTTIDTLCVSDSVFYPFNGIMKQAITETVSYLDGLKYISRKEHLIQIYFYAKDRNTYVSLTTNNYYLKDSTIAYGIVDGYTCVYYGSEKIGCKYLDADKLIVFKDSIANFKSYDEVGGHYDPTGIVFRIVDMDSLAIVKKGMI